MQSHTVRFRVGSDRQTVETVLMLGPAATLDDVRRKLAARGLTSPNQFPASAVTVRSIDPPLTLPDFYGRPIDTPAGHRWAGHATTVLRSSTESGTATIEYTGPDACVLTITDDRGGYRRAYEHDTYAFEEAAALGFPAAGFQHDA